MMDPLNAAVISLHWYDLCPRSLKILICVLEGQVSNQDQRKTGKNMKNIDGFLYYNSQKLEICLSRTIEFRE